MPRKAKLERSLEVVTNGRKTALSRAKEEIITNELTDIILTGDYNTATLYKLYKKHNVSVDKIRNLACAVVTLLHKLQELSDDPEEAKQLLRVQMTEELYRLLQLSKEKKDYRTANAVIENVAKLHGLNKQAPAVQLNNSFGILSKFTEEEVAHMRQGFELPASVLEDKKDSNE